MLTPCNRTVSRRLAVSALAACCALGVACGGDEPATGRPNIVLVLIDTLRADHVSAYGYPRKTTPVIDRLASGGTRFERAISQASWTLPSMMSLFTARHPPELPRGERDIRRVFALDASESTLAERLAAAGYRTLSVTTNPHNVDEIFALMQGFDVKIHADSAAADWVVDRAIEQIGSAASDAPFFLYLHLMDVHEPYAPPPPFDTVFAEGASAADATPRSVRDAGELGSADFAAHRARAEALYDGALRFVDTELGRLLEHLRETGALETTVVAVASDHGEAFWERVALEQAHALHAQGQPRGFGVGHGHSVFRELIEVPMILSGPGVPQGVHPGPVRNLDLAPTLLGLAGLAADPAETDGVDLFATGPRPPALSETGLRGPRQRTLVTAARQLVRIGETELAFDTARPGWPAADAAPEFTAELDAALRSVRRVRFRESYLDPATLDALRALGYLE